MVKLTHAASVLLKEYDKSYATAHEKTISVNPVVSDVAHWYEKFRTAMDYREDEVILRASIERILKRRLIFGGSGKAIAEPLIRELVWARYFPDSSVPEAIILKVESEIDLYLKLEKEINRKHRINKQIVNEWILQLLSAEIEHALKDNHQKDVLSNFIFRLFRDKVEILDDSEETRDVQVFIAVRKAFAKDDTAFLRYQLFLQYFGTLSGHNIDKISDNFLVGFKAINAHFNYSLKDRIYRYINNQTPPFLILEDVLKKYLGSTHQLLLDQDELNKAILEACNRRYRGIAGKIKTAIVRSVIFIFVTKAIFALAIEGTYQSLIYGRIIWGSLALNIFTPAILMIIVGVLIKTPSRENSFRIMEKINSVLTSDEPTIKEPISLRKKPGKKEPILSTLFIILWLVTFVLSFGAVGFVLSKIHLNLLSQGVFIFFLAIVSFISYRINQTANMYTIKIDKENIWSILFDFFFAPLIHVGRKLTQGITQINIILFFFDFIIETPFKGIFAFFEQWFLFLRAQREKLE